MVASLALSILGRLHTARILWTALAVAHKFDVIFVQAIPPPVWWIRILKRFKRRIVFDFDDAVFLHQPERVQFLVENSDVVVAGSHFNLAYAQRLAKRALLVPTPVPIDEFDVASSDSQSSNGARITIGWMGGVTTVKYLELLRDPLCEVAARFPGKIRFTVIGCGNRSGEVPRPPGIDLVTIPRVEPEEVPRYVGTFDIGVMPLFDGDWERGKCALKILEYMAAGIPAVASAVGENQYVIQDGVNGHLAGNGNDWTDKLTALIRSPEERRLMGERGKQTVQQKYSTAVCYEALRTALLG